MRSTQGQAKFDPAMHRSHDPRIGVAQRRIALVAALLVMAAIAAGGGLSSSLGLKRSGMFDVAIAKAQTLADLIRKRSPGTRSEGQLVRTKGSRARSRQLLASKPRMRLPAGGAAPSVEIVERGDFAPFFISPTKVETALPATHLEGPGMVGEAAVLPGAGATGPPGGSPPSTSPPQGPVLAGPSPSAVPEPGTWETMLLGFALIGWLVRRTTLADDRCCKARATP